MNASVAVASAAVTASRNKKNCGWALVRRAEGVLSTVLSVTWELDLQLLRGTQSISPCLVVLSKCGGSF